MVIIRFFLVLGFGVFCSLLGVAAEPSFIEAPKVTEPYAVSLRMESGLGQTLPKEYNDLSCRYVDLGGFVRDENLTVLNENLSSLDSVALGYLNKVKATGAKGDISKNGRISSFITEKRRGEVLQELDRLQKLLKYHDQVNFFRIQQKGNLGVSLFIAQNKEEPFTFKASFVALLKEGEEWAPCLMPSSFANTNMAYDGELRDKTTALEVWAQGELGKYVERVRKKKRADAENKLLALRKGLKEADARVLLDKLAQGLADRDPVQIASVLHLRGGIAEVDKEMRRRYQDSMGLLNALSDPRSIVVPLDPAPCVLSKKAAKLAAKEVKQEAVIHRGISHGMKSKNGETGDGCAFGVILPRFKEDFFEHEEIEPRYLYYLPLYFSSADAAQQKGIHKKHLLGPADRDASPFLGFAPEVFSYNALLHLWSLSNFDDPTMIQRMARDFHRLYPAFQFQNVQDAAKFILAALVAGRYTDLLRCLPTENFSGNLLMQYVKELDALSDQTGILKVSEKNWGLENKFKNIVIVNGHNMLSPKKRESLLVPPIEKVVLYEGKEDAVFCWRQVDGELDQSRFASFNLRKQGDFWYLYLPSEPILAPEGGLSKIAKQLEIYYASQQLHASYQKVAVLKKVEKLESVSKSRLINDFIMTLIKEKNMSELLKYCLVLEDTPESRKRMEEALVEHVLDYGYQSVESRTSCIEVGGEGVFMTTGIHLMDLTKRLLEAPLLFFAQQGERVYWVPELTLLSGLTPKSKEVSEQRLNRAKKFLSPEMYESYKGVYASHCAQVEADGKRR